MVSQARKLREQVRLPLTPSFNNRTSANASENIDQRFVNCFLDVKTDNYSKEQTTYAVKRPGISDITDIQNIPEAGTGSFTTQGMWYFHDVIYFVNDNKLYYTTQASSFATLLHTFAVSVLDTDYDVQIWEYFGSEFSNDFTYRATELLQENIECLYITNGLEDVFVKEGSVLGTPKNSYNRFVANSYYKAGDRVIPSTYGGFTGYHFIVQDTAGSVSLAGAEPTWPSTLGDIVVSGDVVFRCFAPASPEDTALIYTNRSYAVGDLVQPSVESGYFYEVTSAGITTAEPTSWTQLIGDTSTASAIGPDVVFTCVGNYGGKPGLALPMPVYLDTYLVLAPYKSSDLYNSSPSNLYSWNPVDFISADSFTSTTRAISRYNNYIIAYSDKDAELFYNNANTTGSPFSRHESFLLQVGAVSQNTVVSAESVIAWQGISVAGSFCIWLLDGFEPKEISTPWINRMLSFNDPGGDIISSFPLRIGGHLYFVFNTSYVSFIFDIGLNLWYEWYYNESGLGFDFFAFDPKNYLIFLMRSDNNNVFVISDLLYKDISLVDMVETIPIDVKIITQKIDFGNRYRKFGHSLDIIGDTNAGTEVVDPDPTIDVYFSDDDYSNISPNNLAAFPENAVKYSVDMTGRPRITPCGSFRRRAIMLEYSGNLPFRLEGLDLNYTQGIN